MQKLFLAMLSIAFTLITVNKALGHGGGHPVPYNGPAGSVPPNMQPPGSPTPPPAPAPTPTPTPGPTPTPTPAPTPAPTPTPSPMPSPSGASSAGARAGGGGPGPAVTRRAGRTSGSATFEDWDFWWTHNSPPYLNLKERLFKNTGASENAAFFFGRKTKTAAKDTARPTPAYVKKHLIPRMKEALKAKNSDIRDSACVGLGKTGSAEDIPTLIAMIKDKSHNVRGAALLGIGMLQCREGIAPLLHVLNVDAEGVKMRGGRDPEWRLRAMAAAALSLCEDSDKGEVKEALKKYSANTSINKEIRVAATVGLGLLKGDKVYCADLINHLRDLSTKSRFDDFVRAHAVVAIGRIVNRNELQIDPGTVKFINRLVRRDKVSHVRRSAVIALGTIFKGQGDNADPDSLKTLRSEFLKGKGGNMAKNYAAIALSKIGGPSARNSLANVAINDKTQRGAYAAIALGIMCDNLRNKDDNATAMRIKGLNAIRVGFKKSRNPQIQGGYAIALGIARDTEAGSILLDVMKKKQAVALRGYIAIAMGMINYTSATEYLSNVLMNADNLPLLKQQVAIGLGLMGNREVAGVLVKQMKDSSNAYVTTSISKALGFVGDRSTILPLAEMMSDMKAQDITRAYATLALGTVGDRSTISVLSDLFFGHNYLASTGTLTLLQRIMNS